MRKDVVIGLGLAAVAGAAAVFKKHVDQQEIKKDNLNGYGLEIEPAQISFQAPKADHV